MIVEKNRTGGITVLGVHTLI